LIIDRPLDPSTGYTTTADNIAELTNEGIELGVNLAVIRSKTDGFTWDISGQFTKNRNIVQSLGLGDLGALPIAGFTNLGNFAVPGRPYGVIYGSSILRDGNGNYVVGSDGNYLENTDITEIGDPNADWRSTVINEISYKNVPL
jgi:hypothetical protein